MKIEFVESIKVGTKSFNAGDIIILDEANDTLAELNNDYYILIYHGLRYDIHKGTIKIWEK